MGPSADIIETGLSTAVTAGLGNDYVKIIEPVEIGRAVFIRAFSLGLTSDAGETFTTTLSSSTGLLSVRTDLPNSPQILSNNSQNITLIGSDTAIANVLNSGVRFTATGTFVGNSVITMTSQSNQTLSKSEVDKTQLRIIATPTISGISGSIQFVENGVPLLIATPAVVKDIDADVLGSSLKVWSSGFTAPEDFITIANQTTPGLVSLSGNTISFGNIPIGTFSGAGTINSPLQVNFNANATLLGVQAVARRIAFQNRSENPSATPRSIVFQYQDGAGNKSLAATKTVTVLPVNDAPKLTLSGALSAPPNSTAYLFVSTGAVVSDHEQNYANGKLTVILRGVTSATESLSVRSTGTGAGQVGVSGNQISFGGTVIGIISGNGTSGSPLQIVWNDQATSLGIQAVVRRLAYRKTTTAAPVSQRMIDFQLADGFNASSVVATRTLNFNT